jgi:hypothetical protein
MAKVIKYVIKMIYDCLVCVFKDYTTTYVALTCL